MGAKCCAVQCIVNGEENPKIAYSRWDFVTPLEEDRATAIGNKHKNFGRDHACGSGDMLTDIHRHTLQYFTSAPACEVKILGSIPR